MAEPVSPEALTVGGFLNRWLAHMRGRVRPRTYVGYESLLRLNAIPAIGEIPLTALRPLDLQHLYATLLAPDRGLASWNVEHFRNPDSRVDRVVDFLVDLGPPDVFALYEVEGKEVFDALVSKMPGYTFHITEGPQVQEIMLGVKSTFTAFFTQKTEFRSGLWALRPGALLTLTISNEPYPILFLHTKSGVEPLGLGLRDDMLNRALDFKKVLEKAAQGPVNYLFLGDLNTMGMEYKYLRERDIEADQEVLKISRFSAGRGMRLLTKDEPASWWGGPNTLIPPSTSIRSSQQSTWSSRTWAAPR
jgi:hypothetical protein